MDLSPSIYLLNSESDGRLHCERPQHPLHYAWRPFAASNQRGKGSLRAYLENSHADGGETISAVGADVHTAIDQIINNALSRIAIHIYEPDRKQTKNFGSRQTDPTLLGS